MIDIAGLIKKINLMPDSKERAMLICLVYSYINFLVDSNQLDSNYVKNILTQINDIEIFLKRFFTDEKKDINLLISSARILNPMYKDILNYANKYPLFRIDIPNVNITEFITYAEEFFKHIDSNLLSLFHLLLKNELIVETNVNGFGGKCHKLTGDLSGIIIKYDTVNLYKVLTVIHEMGHAYYNYLNKSRPTLKRSNIATESISRILEQLFLIYLKDNNLLKENDILKYERFFMIHQLNLTNSVYIINKLLIEGIVYPNFYIENIKADLLFSDYYDLSIIKPKDAEFNKHISFINNYYSYAFLLSMIVRENYLENKDDTINFIKEIPIYSQNMNAIEFINMFNKNDYLNATKKNISRVLSKTNYKK